MPKDHPTLAAAEGRWPEILAALAGLTAEQLKPGMREIPCPHCGGTDRYRWVSDDGDRNWHCSHCGGARGRGGYDRGISLLCRVRGWTFAQATAEVDRFLGRSTGTGKPFQPRQQVAPSPRLTERICWDLLEAAGQVADDEAYSPARAKGRAYSRRWLRWSAENVEAAEPILAALQSRALEQETAEGIDSPPEQEPERTAEASLNEPGAADLLRQAVADGASQLDLQHLLTALAARLDCHASQLRPLLAAIEAQQAAADGVAAERERIQAAAERSAVAAQMLSLEEVLPPSLAQAIAIRTQYLPVDHLSAVGLFLTTASGVLKVGSELVASRRCAFRVPLNLFSALVGRSGIKKTPVWDMLVTHPMAPIERDLARQAARALEAWNEENRGKKPMERTEKPREARAMCSEFTGEALANQLQRQEADGLGFLIARSEVRALFGGLNQYKPGGKGSDQEMILELYDGGGSSSLRLSAEGGGRFFSRSHVSITGTIQPLVLENLVKNDSGAGMWARFIFLPVPDRIVPLPADESEEDANAMEAAGELLAHTIGAVYRLPRLTLELTDDARAEFMGYELRCQSDAQRSELETQGAAWSKAPGKVLRVAGVLHLLHRVSPDGRHSERVEIETVRAAQNIVDSLTQWALSLHEAAEGPEASDLMRLVHRTARSAGAAIGWRDISRRLSVKARKSCDAAAALAAVDALVAIGVGTRGKGLRGGSWTYTATGDLPS